jgi:hypothetical protein
MRLYDKLIQKGVDPPTQPIPVAGQAMQRQHVLLQPAPQLLDRVEPGCLGRQPDGFDLRHIRQCGLYLRPWRATACGERPSAMFSKAAQRSRTYGRGS